MGKTKVEPHLTRIPIRSGAFDATDYGSHVVEIALHQHRKVNLGRRLLEAGFVRCKRQRDAIPSVNPIMSKPVGDFATVQDCPVYDKPQGYPTTLVSRTQLGTPLTMPPGLKS
jgi:hypothetical protein